MQREKISIDLHNLGKDFPDELLEFFRGGGGAR
jgi:hypothetical protein